MIGAVFTRAKGFCSGVNESSPQPPPPNRFLPINIHLDIILSFALRSPERIFPAASPTKTLSLPPTTSPQALLRLPETTDREASSTGFNVKQNHVSFLQQLTAGAVATMATVTGGMSLGFSAVALPAMQTTNHRPQVSEDQASWIGEDHRPSYTV